MTQGKETLVMEQGTDCLDASRIEWLAMLCNLPPLATELLRRLAQRDEWMALGKLIDVLPGPAFELAQLASPRSPLREWGLVRLALLPEPSLRLNPRIWRFLHTEPSARICDLPLHWNQLQPE